jgi:hypothetical protein
MMWIAVENQGIQIREQDIVRLYIKTLKSRGRGKPKFKIMSVDQLTGYEQELLTFEDYTKASEALYKIVTALDERRARLDI